MLRYIVIQFINGGTDWYDLAAFESEADARDFAAGYEGTPGVEVRMLKSARYEFAN